LDPRGVRGAQNCPQEYVGLAEQITSLRARQASLKNLAREFIEKI
jgi:hypothetical protein